MGLFEDSGGLGLFPDDVLVEIPCRLHVKSLIRLKCVCKSWDYLISVVCLPRASLRLCGLFFRAYALPPHMPLITTAASRPLWDAFLQHLRCFDNKELIDYVSVQDNDGGGGGVFVDPEFLANLPFQKTNANDFLDSYNDLFLFFNVFDCRYNVCNPVMRQYVLIPKARCHWQRHCYAALAFNLSESLYYRVVRFTLYKMENEIVLDIYYSDTEQWVRQQVQIDYCISGLTWIRHSIYFDGALYGLSFSRLLLRFDLNEVSVCVIELPWTENTESAN